MEQPELLAVIQDSWNESVVFVDTGHIIRYMNAPAKVHYAKWGDALGKSIFDCHNPDSCQIMPRLLCTIAEWRRRNPFCG